jgi:putative aminopeptidase FrvX
VELSVPTFSPVTPAEFVAKKDIVQLSRLIAAYLEIPKPPEALDEGPVIHRGYKQPEALIDTYGVAGHEEEIREVVLNRLDLRLQKMAYTDAAGNLVLHLGNCTNEEKTPRILFVAHMDEIGYEVRKIESDGRLQTAPLGEAYQQYFLGHVVLVHRNKGRPVGGVLELPAGWDQAGFEWPSPTQPIHEPLHVFVGTYSREDTEKLGIAVGDSVTIPKEYHRLSGSRASAPSLDDRVGCSALITAANALGPDFSGRDVTFLWSVGKELGSKGAAIFAEQAAKQDRVPDFVFAIDSFVSSDSPLESKRYANAELGKGFVVGAVDSSNVVPPQYLDRVVALAKEDSTPVQYGVSNGVNDGATFLKYGAASVHLGWPLLYSHSPAEVFDAKDFNALAKIVETIARKW